MPKTRRHKINGKAPLRTSRNIRLVPASLPETKWTARGTSITVQKMTGVNKGRAYPYASKRRGGAATLGLRIAPRTVMARV